MLRENSRTEFKSELNDKLEKEVVAFLNMVVNPSVSYNLLLCPIWK